MLINKVEATASETESLKENKYLTTIVVGSTNPLKIQAVKNAVGNLEINVIGCSASSSVPSQPVSEEETRQGAINRAKDSLNKTHAELGIGLETGVFFLNDNVYLCNWGALVDRSENIYVTNGPIILLPSEYRKELLAGQNLEEIMHHSTGIANLGTKQGAIGIFTQNRLTREQVLTEVAKVLLAQYHYFHQVPKITVKSEESSTCLFCKIPRQETQVAIIAKFKHCYAIKDAYPVSNGHTVIIPYEHTENWFTASDEVRLDIMEALLKIKANLDAEYNPDGYNIGINCGKIAGQSIMHLHVHLIPRYKGDMDDPKGGVRGVIPSKQKY